MALIIFTFEHCQLTQTPVHQNGNGHLVEKYDGPKLVDLLKDVEGIEETEKLNLILNCPPPVDWIKQHPFIPNYYYLPIDKVEYLLRKIFKRFKIQVRKTGMLLNSVEVTVRVHYFDIAQKEWMYHDGVGACELQTKSKTGPLKPDMSNINDGAVEMALPIAKSVAVKDACDHFGNAFGCNLNRKNTVAYKPDAELINKKSKLEERVTIMLQSAKTLESLAELLPNITTAEQKELYQTKLTELSNG